MTVLPCELIFVTQEGWEWGPWVYQRDQKVDAVQFPLSRKDRKGNKCKGRGNIGKTTSTYA